ncbi:hypothetical protein HN031_06725 [Nocardioides sp. zg-1308]|uniref:hypothetical protein n=1 Tax=Nocardioides sp. zg-1308 TaxID=2736253 RepID=UPI001555BDBC|nr:hypothetical protein [Nocardioides sp. zg-1308]NPD04381.1 hypothetical protein [Nocardioides sp. zg-1308]
MAESLIVSLPELRSAVERTLDLVEAHLGTEVTLPVDYYWHVPVDEAFDMNQQPREFTAGQVSDDLATMREVRWRSSGEAWHELSHVIGVLRALQLVATA